jgi:uncharacterized protein
VNGCRVARPEVTLILALTLTIFTACAKPPRGRVSRTSTDFPEHPIYKPLPPNSPPELKQLIEGAVAQTRVTRNYDPSYVKLSYPGGDVPEETGVCSDVVVRAFRKIGIDLQKEVHEDMVREFASYPQKWGLHAPDSNIDHRRVPNLMTYFARTNKAVPITSSAADYLPGDIVTWKLNEGTDHIGLVTDLWSESEHRCLIVHNIGAGAQVDDVLFAWPITGHYRYFAF